MDGLTSAVATQLNQSLLPPGWTEHKAPTGHIYYFNKSLNKSTYTRPQPIPEPTLLEAPPQPDAFIPRWSSGQFAGGYNPNQFQAPSAPGANNRARDDRQNRPRRHDGDRPKHKYAIPGCAPWILIKTKYGRRFVHNTETNESFWRFPEDVMKGVTEFDRKERERQERRDRGEPSDVEEEEEAEEVQIVPVIEAEEAESEYEEVTDDGEDEEEPEAPEDEGPREMTEEDMLWQLEQMQQGDGEEYAEDEFHEEEPALSDEDANALFRDLLDDAHISPFTPWDRIVEEGKLVDDERYIALPNMKARRECFDEWSRERIAVIKEKRNQESKRDPKIPYFQLLDEHASTKLFWPEFKRKFRKETAMKDMKLADKEKEKLYREHIKRLGMSKEDLKRDLSKLLKGIPLTTLDRNTTNDALPTTLTTDLRFISLPPKTRNPMIEAYISTLPSAPTNTSAEFDKEAEKEKKRERERREKALREREDKVMEAQMTQKRDIKFGRQRLQEREAELDRAMRVGNRGIRSHFVGDGDEKKDEEMRDAEE